MATTTTPKAEAAAEAPRASGSTRVSVTSLVAVLRACHLFTRFRNAADKVAACVHAFFLASGYRLVAVGETVEKGAFVARLSFSPSLPTLALPLPPRKPLLLFAPLTAFIYARLVACPFANNTSTRGPYSALRFDDDVGLDGWNDKEGEYSFAYIPEANEAVRVVVKCESRAPALHVTVQFAFSSGEFVLVSSGESTPSPSPSPPTPLPASLSLARLWLTEQTLFSLFLPAFSSLVLFAGGEEARAPEPVTAAFQVGEFTQERKSGDLKSGFKNLEKLVDALAALEAPLREQFAPSVVKEEEEAMKEEEEEGGDDGKGSGSNKRQAVAKKEGDDDGDGDAAGDPLVTIPQPASHGDEVRPPDLPIPRVPIRPVGADDLVPPGIRAPGMPSPSPFGGVGVGLGGPMRGSQVGPNDPMFAGPMGMGGMGGPPLFPGQLRGGGGGLGGGASRLVVPPGARFDPINPPGIQGFAPEDFVQPSRSDIHIHPDIGRPPEGPGGNSSFMDHMFG